MATTNIVTKRCIVCDSEFNGYASQLYCSDYCRPKKQRNSYPQQKLRGELRKRELIELSGGKCKICGYDKCIAALSFHHRQESEKSFGLDVRSISNRSMETIMAEFEKCDLLCLNCHQEYHYLNNPNT